MKKLISFLIILLVLFSCQIKKEKSEDTIQKNLIVEKCKDFELNGKGTNLQWENTEWNKMYRLNKDNNSYETKFKILYSETGIYVLAFCEDALITTHYTNDQDDIWKADVFEIFFQTDSTNPLYFEYEINQLNTELILLIPNNNGDFFGWSPWHYEDDRKIIKAVNIIGGEAKTNSKISGWTAEIFFPFTLFKGFKNAPPVKGTKWKGNFNRLDYDNDTYKAWSWTPVKKSFHEYKKYGTIIFN